MDRTLPDDQKSLAIMPPSREFIQTMEDDLQAPQLLSSSLLLESLPEIIENMALGKLLCTVDQLSNVLGYKWLPIHQAHIILDFFCHVLEIRKDADGLFTERIIPIVLRFMLEAEQVDSGAPWLAASKVLFLLAKHYTEIIIWELQNCIQAASRFPPLSALTTLAAAMSYTSVPLSFLFHMLPVICTLMETATDPRTQRALAIMIHNAALTMEGAAVLERGIKGYLTKACVLLSTWETQSRNNPDSEDIMITAIVQVESVLDVPCRRSMWSIEQGGPSTALLPYSTGAIYQPVLSDTHSNTCASPEDYVTVLVQIRHWKDILAHLMPLWKSSDMHNKMTIVSICAALLAYPDCVTGHLYDLVIEEMLRMLDDIDINICMKVLEGITNSARGSPDQALRYRNVFIKTILQKLNRRHQQLLPMMLKTLLAVIQMRHHKTWKKYDRVLLHIIRYMDYGLRDIELYSTILFGEIVDRYSVFPWSPIKKLIKEQCLSLMIKLQSQDTDILSAAAVCLSQCLPHLGCTAMALEEGSEWQDTRYAQAVYRELARKHLLKPMLLRAANHLLTAMDIWAAVRQINAMKEYIAYEELTVVDFRDLWLSLQTANRSYYPDRRAAVRRASQDLGLKWRCLATVTDP